MASGIVGTLATSSSLTYTPSANAKVKICASASGSTGTVTINSVAVQSISSGTSTIMDVYAAAGVPITIATNTYMTAIVSALEAA